jgi:hypothetical protein
MVEVLGMTCYACEKVAPLNPSTALRGPPDCISCEARALALVYGGMKREAIDKAMHLAWTDTKAFKEGRRLFWIWCKHIEMAKEQDEARARG